MFKKLVISSISSFFLLFSNSSVAEHVDPKSEVENTSSPETLDVSKCLPVLEICWSRLYKSFAIEKQIERSGSLLSQVYRVFSCSYSDGDDCMKDLANLESRCELLDPDSIGKRYLSLRKQDGDICTYSPKSGSFEIKLHLSSTFHQDELLSSQSFMDE